MNSKVQQEFLVGALIGGIMGAAVALMYTPVPGAKLRNQISDGLGLPVSKPKAKASRGKKVAVAPRAKPTKARAKAIKSSSVHASKKRANGVDATHATHTAHAAAKTVRKKKVKIA